MELKPGYKWTELGVIPEGWNWVSVGDIASVRGGKRLPPGHTLQDSETPHPYIRVADMIPGGVETASLRFVPRAAFPAIRNYIIRSTDIFISVAGTLGIVGVIPPELDGASLTENADRITDLRCDRDYLKYWLLSGPIQRTIDAIKTVGAQPKLALGRISQFPIALPDDPKEQQAIAEVLGDVDALLAALDKLIAKKRAVKQGVMQQLLTGKTRLPGFTGEWQEKNLGEISEFSAGTYLAQSDYRDGPFQVHGAGNVMGFHNARNFASPISVIGRVGTVGRPRFAPHGCWVNNNAAAIIAKERAADPRFVHVLLSQLDWRAAISVTAQPFLVIPALMATHHSVPDLEEQRAISRVIDDMDAEVIALEERREKAKLLKQGMMQELLTGKTRLV